MTREMLDDLLVDIPRIVSPDVDAAWRIGTLRRRRAQALRAVVVAVVATLVGLGIAGFDAPRAAQPAEGTDGVNAYPSLLRQPFPMTDLPAAPGPLAGVLQTDDGWAAFDADGRSWAVADLSDIDSYPPALSDDGRVLGYLRRASAERSEYVVLDLVTGERTEVPQVGDGRSVDDDYLADQDFFHGAQGPGFWSPDDQWVALHGGSLEKRGGGPLLVSRDGMVREVAASGWPVGWLSRDQLLLIRGNGVLVTVDPSGDVLGRVTLDLPNGVQVFGQWAGRLSPDGSRVAMVYDGPPADEGEIAVFDVATGQLVDQAGQSDDFATGCAMAWRADRVLAWDDGQDALIGVTSGEVVVRASDVWGEVYCGLFATDALQGERATGPGALEWRYWALPRAWPLLAGLFILAVGTGAAWLRWRRRKLLAVPT